MNQRHWQAYLALGLLFGLLVGCASDHRSSGMDRFAPTEPGPEPEEVTTGDDDGLTTGLFAGRVVLPGIDVESLQVSSPWLASDVAADGAFSVRVPIDGTALAVAHDDRDRIVGLALAAMGPALADTHIDVTIQSTAAAMVYLYSGSWSSDPEVVAVQLAHLGDLPEIAWTAELLSIVVDEFGYIPFDEWDRLEGLGVDRAIDASIRAFNREMRAGVAAPDLETFEAPLRLSEDDGSILDLLPGIDDLAALSAEAEGDFLAPLEVTNRGHRWLILRVGDVDTRHVGIVGPAQFELPDSVIGALLDIVGSATRAVWDAVVGGQDLLDALAERFSAMYGRSDAIGRFEVRFDDVDARIVTVVGPGFNGEPRLDSDVVMASMFTGMTELLFPILELVGVLTGFERVPEFTATTELNTYMATAYGAAVANAIFDLASEGGAWSFVKDVTVTLSSALIDPVFYEWLARSAGGGMVIGEATSDQVQRFLGRFVTKILNPLAAADRVLGLVDFGVNAGILVRDLARSPTHNAYLFPAGAGAPGPEPDTPCIDADSDGACAISDCDDTDPAVLVCDSIRPLADSDGDCVPDGQDSCPDTPPGQLVDPSGCSALDWLDPCADFPTHGAFVSWFSAIVQRYYDLGLLTDEPGQLIRYAAQSDVGKPPQAASNGPSCEDVRDLIDFRTDVTCEPTYSDGSPVRDSDGDGLSSVDEVSRCLTGATYPLTQDYLEVGPWNPTIGDVHAGLDFGTGAGTDVYAGVHAEVIRVDRDALGLVALYLPDRDVTVLLLHMTDIAVAPSDTVEPNTFIGLTGSVGATAAHLHVEARPGRRVQAVGEPSGEVAAASLDVRDVIDCE